MTLCFLQHALQSPFLHSYQLRRELAGPICYAPARQFTAQHISSRKNEVQQLYSNNSSKTSTAGVPASHSIVLETPVAMHAGWGRELRIGSNMIW
jgi:hypothetical protein